MPINWKNVNAPNLGGAARILESAGRRMDAGISSMDSLLKNRDIQKHQQATELKERNSRDAINSLLQYQTPEELNTALAGGELNNLSDSHEGRVNQGSLLEGAFDINKYLQNLRKDQDSHAASKDKRKVLLKKEKEGADLRRAEEIMINAAQSGQSDVVADDGMVRTIAERFGNWQNGDLTLPDDPQQRSLFLKALDNAGIRSEGHMTRAGKAGIQQMLDAGLPDAAQQHGVEVLRAQQNRMNYISPRLQAERSAQIAQVENEATLLKKTNPYIGIGDKNPDELAQEVLTILDDPEKDLNWFWGAGGGEDRAALSRKVVEYAAEGFTTEVTRNADGSGEKITIPVTPQHLARLRQSLGDDITVAALKEELQKDFSKLTAEDVRALDQKVTFAANFQKNYSDQLAEIEREYLKKGNASAATLRQLKNLSR